MEQLVREAPRFRLIEASEEPGALEFARDVEAGLRCVPKHLPCRYLYDAHGSLLFEEITRLEEYYPPRCETEILSDRSDEIVGMLPRGSEVVELGSGSATKTRLILEAMIRRQRHTRFIPIDISRSILVKSSNDLLEDHPELVIAAVAGEYHEGLEWLRGEPSHPRLILWLGSNIGNFDRQGAAGFLRLVRTLMSEPDRLLVGIDLRKPAEILNRAYDDSRGVTAQFNKNLLKRINRELGGHFVLDGFDHRAQYRERAGKVEMHLVSKEQQVVQIEALDLGIRFGRGEAIHTEDSHKYSLEEIAALMKNANLRIEHQWLDSRGWFSETLVRR